MNSSQYYNKNITEFPARKISKIWKPQSIDELKEILHWAGENGEKVHPISTGHNWGLGSKLPVEDSNLIVLNDLNSIVEVNEELAYARIQPGVTQLQLANYLKKNHPDFLLNVTGGSAHSSILANAIERGSGKNGHRANDIRELKIMLASGEEISTGFGNRCVPGRGSSSFYRYGSGPDFTHLFTQSNFGIVTEAVISLMPKEPFTLFLSYLDLSQLGQFLGTFSQLVRKGIIGHSLEIDSQDDPKIFELFEEEVPEDRWICWFAVYGEESIRTAKIELVKEALEVFCSEIRTYYSGENHAGAPAPIQVRMLRYSGIPTDHSLISTAKAFGVQLSEENPDIDVHKQLPGFRCILPVIPFSKEGSEVISLIYEISAADNQKPVISIIGLDNYSLEVFARVYFDRSNENQISAANQWAKKLLEALADRNIFPYRVDVENMISQLLNDNLLISNLKNSIKQTLDPQGIISPGRYQMISSK